MINQTNVQEWTNTIQGLKLIGDKKFSRSQMEFYKFAVKNRPELRHITDKELREIQSTF